MISKVCLEFTLQRYCFIPVEISRPAFGDNQDYSLYKKLNQKKTFVTLLLINFKSKKNNLLSFGINKELN